MSRPLDAEQAVRLVAYALTALAEMSREPDEPAPNLHEVTVTLAEWVGGPLEYEQDAVGLTVAPYRRGEPSARNGGEALA